MIVIGIDPGIYGCVAMLGHRAELLQLGDMPTMQRGAGSAHVKQQVNPGALAQLVCEWTRDYSKNEIQIFLEEARPMPTVARRGGKITVLQGSATTFSMGLTAGLIEGAIGAKGYTYKLVPATQWKKHYKLTSNKEQARAAAVRLYPSAPLARKKDHNRAEALLIARFGHEQVA